MARIDRSISSLFARLADRYSIAPAVDGPGGSRITVHQLKELIGGGEDLMLVDIRLPWEYQAGHIPGSISIPYFEITEAVRQGILCDRRVVLYCRVGVKSIRTRNVLRAMGVEGVVDLVGGIFAWEEAGWETVTPGEVVAKREAAVS